ncbi:hypothetical protein ACFL35_13585 [Candidatus Riflebacteria bacterium]
MADVEEYCENCIFFEEREGGKGICRRYPPCPKPEGGITAFWPVIELDDWCGEFEADEE